MPKRCYACGPAHAGRLVVVVAIVAAVGAACSPSDADVVGAPTSTATTATATSGPSPSVTTAPPATTPATTSAPVATVAPPELPPTPPSSTGPAGESPDQRALRLAVATDPAVGDEVAVHSAWMEAYAAAAVPVLAGLPSQVTADDPLGPPAWAVWMLAGAPADAGMSLADTLKPIVSSEDTIVSDADAAAAARTFLTDLATARDTGDPVAVFLAAFLEAQVEHPGVPGLFDPALDPIATTIDLPTSYLLQWVVVRGLMSMMFDAETVAAAAPSGFAPRHGLVRSQPSARQVAGAPCSEYWGSEDATTITNTLISKVLGGFEIPGVTFTGLIERVIDLNEGVISKLPFERATKVIGKVNVATTIAALLMQLTTIKVGGEFGTLVRHKTRAEGPGERVTNRLDLSIDPGALPDQNDRMLCVLSTMANAAGLTLSFPPAGPLSGVEVILSNGANIPDRVLINAGSLKMTTDANGSVTFELIGVTQRRDHPESSAKDLLDYGVTVEAQLEPISGNSIFNTFFDSLTAPIGGAIGYVAPALDILKTIHWDLGEQRGPLIDWKPAAYRISGSQGEETIDQVVCDVGVPFTLQGSVMTMNFTPGAGAVGGDVETSGSTGGATFTGEGTYVLNLPNGFGADGTMQVDLINSVEVPGAQMSMPLSIPFTMTALEDAGC